MSLDFLDTLNIKIGDKYLDIAEGFPKFNKGVIARLQTIREYQRKDSRETFEKSKPPKNVNIEYIGLQLIETFDLKNFDKLSNVLKRLNQGRIYAFDEKKINKNRGSLTGAGWTRLGYIAREGVGFPRPNLVLPDLPEYIDTIELVLYRILPSQYVLSFQVWFKETISQQFNNLINKYHLPKIRFHSILPWNLRKKGYKQFTAASASTEEFTEWYNSIRCSIEKCIRPFIKGGFFTEFFHKNKVRLPCINCFALRDDDKTEMSLKDWTCRHNWLRFIGFNLYGPQLYKSPEYVFIWPNINETPLLPLTLIALENDIIKQTDISMYGDKKNAIMYKLWYTNQGLVPSFSIILLLQSLKIELENNRLKIVEAIKPRISSGKLNKATDLNNLLLSLSMKLDEVNNEFQHDKAWIKHDLKNLTLARNEFDDDTNFKEAIIFQIESQLNVLLSKVKILRESFSAYVGNINIKIMFKLQRKLFWLTAIVVIATIIGIVSNIKEIVESVKFVSHKLSDLLRFLGLGG